jgi:hypothetical protein
MEKEKKYSLFHIEGGLGKHIAATAVAKTIKNNHPDRELVVVCAYPQIFLNLNYVHRVYRIGNTPYFHKDYIEGKDSLIFKHEPYFTTDHIHKKLNLIENWCKLYNLEYNGEQPELKFNPRELQKYNNMWKSNKPIFVIQSNGGMITQDSGLPYRWTRDMPYQIVQAIVDRYKDDYNILQVTRPGSPVAIGATGVFHEMTSHELLSILLYSSKRLLIDSSLQHAAAALNLPSTVLWVGTSSKLFGYDIHDNIHAEIPEDQKLPDSYFFDYDFEGLITDYPFETETIFDIEDIIKSLTKQGL